MLYRSLVWWSGLVSFWHGNAESKQITHHIMRRWVYSFQLHAFLFTCVSMRVYENIQNACALTKCSSKDTLGNTASLFSLSWKKWRSHRKLHASSISTSIKSFISTSTSLYRIVHITSYLEQARINYVVLFSTKLYTLMYIFYSYSKQIYAV